MITLFLWNFSFWVWLLKVLASAPLSPSSHPCPKSLECQSCLAPSRKTVAGWPEQGEPLGEPRWSRHRSFSQIRMESTQNAGLCIQCSCPETSQVWRTRGHPRTLDLFQLPMHSQTLVYSLVCDTPCSWNLAANSVVGATELQDVTRVFPSSLPANKAVHLRHSLQPFGWVQRLDQSRL